jgi:hypothetical protein
MPDLITLLSSQFGTLAAYIAVFVFLSSIVGCIYKKQWPDTGPMVIMLLSTLGTASGAKIAYLMLALPADKLGALADDKGALMIGGLATLTLSLKETCTYWRKVTGI